MAIQIHINIKLMKREIMTLKGSRETGREKEKEEKQLNYNLKDKQNIVAEKVSIEAT